MNQSLSSAYSGRFVFLSAIFTACLVISNIIAGRLIAIGPFILPAAVLVFPLTYILGDIFTEVYGYKKARLVIWAGFAANCLLVGISVLAIALPAPGFFDGVSAYKTVLMQTPRTVIASLLAFWCGEFLNAFVLSRLKTATKGKYLPLRTITSTLAGQAVDSAIFLAVAFAFSMPALALFVMILTQWIFKVVYEAVFTPLTVLTVAWLKKAEGTDVYDEGISYNPFGG
jgi:uncharacterized integral membrane protein (TIGR00697 family)